MRSIVIHGHFYQPPRENPWLEEIEREASAAPHHDWNARIEQECYRAVVAARVLTPDGRISRIVNTLEHLSFNFGPTLLEWMERAAPDTYARILEADRKSLARLGHGNAIAQPYHHAILPLSSRRDKVTEVRWGIADFRRRFGREPEGMWLPETALDDETLDVLAQEGIRFTIVAPGQVESVPDDGHPGRYTTSSGRTIALCIYDGDISHGIAFGALLGDAHLWTKRLLARAERRHTPRESEAVAAGGESEMVAAEPDQWEPDPLSDGGTRPLTVAAHPPLDATLGGTATRAVRQPRGGRHRLVSAATDGETYGHHHKFSEMALARVLLDLGAMPTVRVENFASYLARHPALDDVRIVAPSAWSCAHGVERWRSNCGCRMRAGTSQEWRTPLRDAITTLADGVHAVYDREARHWFDDPWAVRDAYGEVVATPEKIGAWVAARVRATPAAGGSVAGGEAAPEPRRPGPESLLEMERGALRIFTSCAWFFDDIAGLEPIEVLRYAARAIELAGPDGPRLEQAFIARLADAVSNEPGVGTGRDVYLAMAKPALDQLERVAGSVGAARELAPDDSRSVDAGPALVVTADGDRIDIRQLRTGAHDTFAVRVDGGARVNERASSPGGAAPLVEVASPAMVVATVRALSGGGGPAARDGAPPNELTLAEMTERQRDVIAEAVRRQLIERAFDSGTLAELARSGRAVRDRLRGALELAVSALRHDRSPEHVGRVLALLDLVELEGMHVPFDAQTRFSDLYRGEMAVAQSSTDLEAIAIRLGFARAGTALPVPSTPSAAVGP